MSTATAAAQPPRACRAGEPPPRERLVEQLRALLSSEPRSWRLEVTASKVLDAGDGVHLHGECEAGAVLACYPGVSFLPEDLPVMHQLVLTDNSYVMARRDGVLIDGREDGPSRQIREMAKMRDQASGAQASETSSFSVGNKVNHPPPGSLPNVLVFPFDLRPEEEEADLRKFFPVWAFRPPAAGEPQVQTVVLAAKRALKDEELLLDYKLGAQGPLEPWYHPVQNLVQDGSEEELELASTSTTQSGLGMRP